MIMVKNRINVCALLLEKQKQGIAVAVGDWYFERTKQNSS